MNYKDKYIKYKAKYLELKNNINNQIGGNKKQKCLIDETDKIMFGNGGSSSIIIITKNNQVFKVFIFYNFILDIELKRQIKINNHKVKSEIKICELLTKKIVDKNISNHIVKYKGLSNCKNAELLFTKCSKSYVDFLKLDVQQKTDLCYDYFRRYPLNKINSEYKVIEIEYCDYSCAEFIKDISKLSEFEMEKYLNIFFFQIIYTILSIQKEFPYFTHNDLFIRNILGIKEIDTNNFYTYVFNNKKYYVPQKIFFPKINDFGLSNLNSKYKNVKLFKSLYKDIYNIIFDVYDGAGMGSTSLSELCKNNPNKLQFLKKYFSNYFNVNVIDEYKIKSKNLMNRNWSHILDDEFLKSIEMKNPFTLLDEYFYNIFGKN